MTKQNYNKNRPEIHHKAPLTLVSNNRGITFGLPFSINLKECKFKHSTKTFN